MYNVNKTSPEVDPWGPPLSIIPNALEIAKLSTGGVSKQLRGGPLRLEAINLSSEIFI
jgi:hypothetical protein